MSFKSRSLFLSLIAPVFLLANEPASVPKPNFWAPFHGFVATGYAWSMEAGIYNPQPGFWDLSSEGYDSTLGNVSFFTLGIGYRFWKMLDVDFNYNFYDTFHYQKRQTSMIGQSGSVRVRYFDLDNQSGMLNFSLYPYAISLGSSRMELVPFIGLGIGVAVNQISNFYTVGNDVSGIGSVTSVGNQNTRIAFAWQGMGGFRIHPKNSMLSADIAYRYYNGGAFEGPSTITSFADSGEQFTGKPWKGTLQTNQLYVSLNVSL